MVRTIIMLAFLAAAAVTGARARNTTADKKLVHDIENEMNRYPLLRNASLADINEAIERSAVFKHEYELRNIAHIIDHLVSLECHNAAAQEECKDAVIQAVCEIIKRRNATFEITEGGMGE